MKTNRTPLYLDIDGCLVEASVQRAREQEKIYGHNTGHFRLEVEKENTVIGVIGEFLVRQTLIDIAKSNSILVEVDHTTFGAPLDLKLTVPGRREEFGVHVKTGLWNQWPQETFEFGVHADQKIEFSNSPLILVTLLKNQGSYPKKARIEGFIKSHDLRRAKVIKRGDQFPSTGVISRTDNYLTRFSQYEDVKLIFQSALGLV